MGVSSHHFRDADLMPLVGSGNETALHRVYIGRQPFSVMATFQAEFLASRELYEWPQVAMRRANKFLRIQPESDFCEGDHVDVTGFFVPPHVGGSNHDLIFCTSIL